MSYEVRLQPLAERDLDAAYRWAAKSAPHAAAGWLTRFQKAIQSLAVNPERCGSCPENSRLNRELRQFLFGRRPNVFRVVFLIDGKAVRVIRIRRAARRGLSRRDLGES